MIKRLAFGLYRLGLKFGVHIIPEHYYCSLADIRELKATKELWAKASMLPGLNWNPSEQLAEMDRICRPFTEEVAGNKTFIEASIKNLGPGYGYIEAQALHAVIRHFNPKRIIEVGSGVSTYCSLAALQKNRENTGKDFSVTCIEPYPNSALRTLQDINLLERKVQETPLELFEELGENDLLFVDSSHTVKPGGDVNFLYLEVFPRLKAGVIIHIHDIYLPYDYPRVVLQSFFQWMETSLLRAFLIHNSRAKVLFCLSYLHHEHKDALKEVFPEYTPDNDSNGLVNPKICSSAHAQGHFPSSIYIQIL